MIYSHHISSAMSDQELVQNTDLHKQTEMKNKLELAPRGQLNLSTTYTIELADFNESETYEFAHGWDEKFQAGV